MTRRYIQVIALTIAVAWTPARAATDNSAASSGWEIRGTDPQCHRLDVSIRQLLVSQLDGGSQFLVSTASQAAAAWQCSLPLTCQVLGTGLGSPTLSLPQSQGITTSLLEFKCNPQILLQFLERTTRTLKGDGQ